MSTADMVESYDWIPDGFKLSFDDIEFVLCAANGQRQSLGDQKSSVCDVYEGTVNKNGNRVGCAVKIYRYDASNRYLFLRHLQNEVNLLYLARGNQYVARFLGVLVPTPKEENHERLAVVTKLVKGSTLKERHEGKQATSTREVTAVMLQIARAMDYLHVTQIRHLDLTPNNVIYVTDEPGDEERYDIKLLDLGHSRLQNAAACSSGLSSCIAVDKRHGTAGYRAPEILGEGEATSKSDIFSFGCLMYFVLYGRAPFVTPPSAHGFVDEKQLVQGRWPSVSGDLQHIITQCWLPEPLGRPSFRLIEEYLKRDSSTYALPVGKSFAFISEVDRLGSHSEKEHCKVIAGQLACEELLLTTTNYQTRENFLSAVERGATCCKFAEFAVFIFSSHGYEGHLQIGRLPSGTPIVVRVNDILGQIARVCPSEQMKLVLFNKCRRRPPSGHQDISSVPAFLSKEEYAHPKHQNFHVCSATMADGDAYRDEDDGALFLRAIRDVADSMKGDRLFHLFPKVREELRKQLKEGLSEEEYAKVQPTQEVSTLEPEWVGALLSDNPKPASQRPLDESRNPAADLLHLFSPPPPSWDVSKPLISWEGITVADNQEVTKIALRPKFPMGTAVNWEVLGRFFELRTLILEVGFVGKVNFTDLPASLQHLHLNDNSFEGSVDLTQLPPGLLSLHLGGNELSGPVDLTTLPVHLESLRLHGDKFSDSVDLSALPHHLTCLWLHGNQFSGTVDLCQLITRSSPRGRSPNLNRSSRSCRVTVGAQ